MEFVQETYTSPLVQRNASSEMSALFSQRTRVLTWRRLWIVLAEAERELGLKITLKQITQLKRAIEDIDFDAAAEYERRFRHDVMAHLYAFAEKAPSGRSILHLGATSAFVVDNGDLIIMRDGLRRVRDWLVNLIEALADFAGEHRKLPTLGFTHFQPAQPTTVGKRACLWCYDFVQDLQEIEHCLGGLRFRGTKGATGTQAAFLKLFNGDHAKVRRLDRLVARKMGFEAVEPITGQTFSRKVDARVLSALAQIGASVHKMANDIRLLANLRELEEPFEDQQVGSSAMAYKRNPMRCERATSLARFLITLAGTALHTAAEQWLERTLDDSACRRVIVPEAFLAADGILRIMTNVARGLVVYPRVIRSHMMAELPFLATEDLLMAVTAAGGDRQEVHERIRRHAHQAAAAFKLKGQPFDLLERLGKDPLFDKVDVGKLLAPDRYVGRAPQQVSEFLRSVVRPILRKHKDVPRFSAELQV
jgi:adenylosuccinate lyase